MKQKNDESEKKKNLFETSKSTFKKSKWNGKCHVCGIYGNFARECATLHFI
jgi:predicted ATP-dependent serine protease